MPKRIVLFKHFNKQLFKVTLFEIFNLVTFRRFENNLLHESRL